MINLYNRISFRINALILLFIFIPTGITAFYYNSRLDEDLKNELLIKVVDELDTKTGHANAVLDFLSDDAVAVADHMSNQLNANLELADSVSSQPASPRFLSSALRNTLAADFKTEISATNQIAQLRLINAKGDELVKVVRASLMIIDTPPEELQNKSDMFYFKLGMENRSGKPLITEPTLNMEHGEPSQLMVRLTQKVFLSNGKLFGIIALNVDAGLLFRGLPPDRNNGYQVIDDEGFYLLHEDKSKLFGRELGHNSNLLDEEPELRNNLKEQDSTIHWDPGQKEYRVWKKVFFSKTDKSRYLVFLHMVKESSILGDWAKTVKRGGGVLLVIAILSLVLINLLVNRALHPLTALTNSIRSLEAGNLSVRSNYKSETEIGEINEAFNSMAMRLEKKTSLLKLIQEITCEANEASDADEAMFTCLGKICEYTGWEVGHAYLVNEDGVLHPSEIWTVSDPEEFESFRELTKSKSFAPGEGLPGRVYKSGKPIWITDINNDPDFPRKHASGKLKLKTGMAFPVNEGKNITAVLEFFTLERIEPDQIMLDTVSNLATGFGRILERKRAEEKIRLLSLFPATNPNPVIRYNKDGKLSYGNKASRPLLVAIEERILSSDASEWFNLVRETYKTGTPHKMELNLGFAIFSVMFTSIPHSDLVYAYGEDITERRRAEESLKLSEKVIQSASEGVMVTDANIKIKAVNPAFTAITGYSPEEVIGKNPSVLQSYRHDKKFYKEMWDSIINQGRWHGEIWDRRKNGEAYIEKLTITAIKDSEGRTTQYASIFHDITELKLNQEEIEYKAYYDSLTGLPNRQLLMDRMKLAIARAKRNDEKLGVLFIDLDGFKHVNDSLGHAAGDLLLQGVSVRLVSELRDEDTVARLGGDEFLVILEKVIDEQEASAMARRLIESITEPFNYKGEDLFISLSIGVAIYPVDGESVEELLKHADMAMYHVKDEGKNNFKFFSSSMNERAGQRMLLEKNLRRAIQNKEFQAYYQPKVELVNNQVIGMEALVRWITPDGTIIPPDDFIPLAEETGLVVEIDEWMLKTSCEFFRRMQICCIDNEFNLNVNISVNLSTKYLDRADLVKMVVGIAQNAQVEPENIELEVTESSIVRNMDHAIAVLSELRSKGFNISMDDFGTGYSSLNYLTKLPVNRLKIDKSFIDNVDTEKVSQSVAKAIVIMGHELGMSVTAEGVENAAQLDFLRSIGCDQIQGYLFSKPLPADRMEELLVSHKSL